MFPLGHGEALAEEIPGATLLPLEGAGHGVDRGRLGDHRGRDPRAHSRWPIGLGDGDQRSNGA